MQDLKKLRDLNLKIAKKKVKESINEDNLISQTINSIDEIDKVSNTLVKRLKEWYSLYNPEFVVSISNNQKFVDLIQKKSKNQLLNELKVKETMGADLSKPDLGAIMVLAKEIESIMAYKETQKKYLESLMKKYCPNLHTIAGTTIGAKLIEHTGSLRKLAVLPSSTIQILGAEKALFRHIKTGAKPPKFGIIHDHQFILQSNKAEQGKKARALADKISLAVRTDFFKGKFIADKLNEELKLKFK